MNQCKIWGIHIRKQTAKSNQGNLTQVDEYFLFQNSCSVYFLSNRLWHYESYGLLQQSSAFLWNNKWLSLSTLYHDTCVSVDTLQNAVHIFLASQQYFSIYPNMKKCHVIPLYVEQKSKIHGFLSIPGYTTWYIIKFDDTAAYKSLFIL